MGPVNRPLPRFTRVLLLLVMTARLLLLVLHPTLLLLLMPLQLLLPVLLTLDMERGRLMPRLPQMPRPPPRLTLDTMVTLPQLSRLLQSVSQSQSRNVTRSQSPPQERLEEPSARLWLTSPPLKTVQRPSPPSASRSAPRLLIAQLLLVITPRLDQLRWLLMLLLPQLLLLLLQLLLDMVDMDWLDMAAGDQTLVPLYHINIIVLNKGSV